MVRQVGRRSPITGTYRVPASKPETQRALVMAAMAAGRSTIDGALQARETALMVDACRALGAVITFDGGTFTVDGVGQERLRAAPAGGLRWIWAGGSAFVARSFTAMGAALPGRTVVDGNGVLRGRPFAPLFDAMRAKGVNLAGPEGDARLPAVVQGGRLAAGPWRLGTGVSSQFATALLLAAPLTGAGMAIELEGQGYSLSYIGQTLDVLRRFGVPAAADGPLLRVPAGYPVATDLALTGDWTSASYIIGAALVTRGKLVLENLDLASLQGERAIADIASALGAKLRDLGGHRLLVDCTSLPGEVDLAFDLTDSPNILPTVAAITATLPGRVRITGARLTQHHKSPRVQAMAAELGKAQIQASVLRDGEGQIDGLEIRGRQRHAGGVAFTSHGDHRIFMATALLAFAGDRPSSFPDAAGTEDSFPAFAELLLDAPRYLEGAA